MSIVRILGIVALTTLALTGCADEPRKPGLDEIRDVKVARVVSGDTFVTDTGEAFAVYGLYAPNLGECYEAESTAFARSQLEGRTVTLGTFGYRNDPAVRYERSVVAYGEDFAYLATRDGYATYAAIPFSQVMTDTQTLARDQQLGMHGPACFPPVVPPPPAQPATPGSDVPDVDVPHVDPDKPRVCDRKWWC